VFNFFSLSGNFVPAIAIHFFASSALQDFGGLNRGQILQAFNVRSEAPLDQGKTISTLRQSFTADAHLSVQFGALVR
jgi:hypothetical protein